MGKGILFVLIPLILTIGIVPAFPISNADYMDNIYRDPSETECREGKVLVYHFTANDYICTSQTTSLRWVQLGIAEIVGEPVEVIEQVEEVIEEPSDEIELPPYPEQPSIHPKLLATNDFWSPPTVHKVTDGVYSAVGYDGANSIMIEGDDGIIIVDTLSTYEAAKQVITEFRKNYR